MTREHLALFFTVPFVIAGIAVSAWFLCAVAMNKDTSDPYEDEDNLGRH